MRENTTQSSPKDQIKGTICEGASMPSAPDGNYSYHDGLKDQVNIKLCSKYQFKEGRGVFKAVMSIHWVKKKKKVFTSHCFKSMYYFDSKCNQGNCIEALLYYLCLAEGFLLR